MGKKHDVREVLAFIVNYKAENDGVAPSIREIMAGCGISSSSLARDILGRLELLGKIRMEGREARSIRVVGGRYLPPDPSRRSETIGKRVLSLTFTRDNGVVVAADEMLKQYGVGRTATLALVEFASMLGDYFKELEAGEGQLTPHLLEHLRFMREVVKMGKNGTANQV